ncbi:siroheme synthase CysG [Pelistega europaea]|uniref:Siroheme synthase n=1 Tax=Pelistega europaea TaxID=106147 RepID=A0A7Y4L8P1_9BURK|nr:siroheme synthase CysG [Pelistega europaea]NOL48938.1 uroporphyrinogen-III C-methyltransferase [Pelistega europaea]
MQYLPIFVDLQQKTVLVVGGGHIAQRKIALLREAGAQVRVVAQELISELAQLWQAGEITWLARQFTPNHLEDVALVVTATDDSALNQQVFEQAKSKNLWVNTVDNQTQCSFIFPSIIDRSPVQIAISSAGKAPVLARLLREKLEAILPQHLATMAQLAGRWRSQVKGHLSNIRQRRYFWESLFENTTFQRLSEQRHIQQAEVFLEKELKKAAQHFVANTKDISQNAPSTLRAMGEVVLVGAGPGDAGLLTLKGLQAIQRADVILYDALVSEEILALTRRDADKVLVGKRAQQTSISQQQINQLLIQHALQGKRVVRLKGGDPFVFGRGGEELQALKAEGIPFSVVPGITAAVGVTAYAGIPLTHRDYAQSVTFITGHLQAKGQPLDWAALANSHHTLVVYMGVLKSEEIQQQLLRGGRDAHTPVAVISRGTSENQQIHIGTLQNLTQLAELAEKPALLVIGDVVALQQNLHWFGEEAIHVETSLLLEKTVDVLVDEEMSCRKAA